MNKWMDDKLCVMFHNSAEISYSASYQKTQYLDSYKLEAMLLKYANLELLYVPSELNFVSRFTTWNWNLFLFYVNITTPAFWMNTHSVSLSRIFTFNFSLFL